MAVDPSTRATTLAKIKNDRRISHTALDTDIGDQIEACLADLVVCGIADPDETDTNILAVLKIYCRAAYQDDTTKAAAYMERYRYMVGTLMMAEGYGGPEDDDD